MKKKIISVILSGFLCISLSACGTFKYVSKEDTASNTDAVSDLPKEDQDLVIELINNIDNLSKNHSTETIESGINLEQDIVVENYGEITTKMEGISRFNADTYNMNITTTYYLNGEQPETDTTNLYQVTDGNNITIYLKEGVDPTWYKSTVPAKDVGDINLFNGFDVSKFSDITFYDTGDAYIITANTTSNVFGDNITELTGTSEGIPVKARLEFDKNKEYKSITFELDPYMVENIYSVVSCKITMTNNGYTKDTIEIPKEVIENAIEDQSLLYENTTQTPSDTESSTTITNSTTEENTEQ